MDLINYQKNITSQFGEDGIIEEICKRLSIDSGYFVEFGAWDGKRMSNTYSLLSKSWRGVYIEKDQQKYKDLLKTKDEYPNQIITICSEVSDRGETKLDRLLEDTFIPNNFDLLSIDIDSYDWQVWYSVNNYRPKIVIIEGNSTVLPGIWQFHGAYRGASFTALVALGKHKGYKLVCHTGNLIFVTNELVDKLNIDPVNLLFPETLFNYKKHFQELRNIESKKSP